jgi:4a-hydroxytetrahydrobiopterin dehydratase
MKPSLARKKISRAQARNAMLLNQLGTPGLGTLLAGRRLEGVLQLLLFLAGFVLFCLWAVRDLSQYYEMMFRDAPNTAPGNLGLACGGAGICALAWVWSLQTSFSLLREASKVSLESLESFAAGQVKMEPAKIILALATLPQWQRAGEIISRTFVFKDFPAAMKFVNAVADLAEQAQHHPDVDIRWNKVTLALTTHDAGGLTEKDFELARQLDREGKTQNAE